MSNYILSLDQGTTSSRAILFNSKGEIHSLSQREFKQIYPQPGWVEHNPQDIWQSQLTAAREAVQKGKLDAGQIAAIGITNQRETTILWDNTTGKPVYNAIVWQCRRTRDICRRLEQAGLAQTIRKKTGLLLDPYFSGTKIMWLLENIPGLRQRAQRGEIAFGTVDSWLLYNLTGEHLTDPSNASRTLLYNINKGIWDKELLKELNIPPAMLPRIVKSSCEFGISKKQILGSPIPVCGVAGDQQAALFGQTCFRPGNTKNTYGTGCFVLMHTGKKPIYSKNNLLTTVAWDLGHGPEYALEGSVFVAGAVVQWLRDELKIIKQAAESEKLASSVPDTGGVYFVPAFVGLGAPYWNSGARGTLLGLTRGSGRAHIVRAALESIAYQCKDLLDAMARDTGKRITALKVDGGAAKNNFLMQFQADVLNMAIQRPVVAETTALGAAYLAGLASGFWPGLEQIEDYWKLDKEFKPRMDTQTRKEKLTGWQRAVETACGFVI